MANEGTICYFDIKLGDDDLERIVMKLYDDVVPRTCANFKALCTGEQKTDELNLHFLNSIFHRGARLFLVFVSQLISHCQVLLLANLLLAL